jgi:glycosyltransferase involved in cell wall biosynthesis
MVTIGACLIVRDEERCIARCLNSLIGVVDEIVVVDTGSEDATVAIAESLGARISLFPWTGDFSAARNFSLNQARSDWILYIDADEYLQPVSRSEVAEALSDSERHIAYRLRLRHQQGFTPYFEYRIWRNRPDIRFEGVIHESIVPSIRAIVEAEHRTIGETDFLLEHDGYEGDQRHKHERNLPLLLEQVKLDPNRTYLWNHIGRIRQELGQADAARAAWVHGVELVRKNGARQPSDCLVYFDLILTNAFEKCPDESLVREAVSLFPDNVLIYWGAALDAMAREDHVATIAAVDALLAIPPDETARLTLGINERITNEWAPHARGMANFKLGRRRDAALDFAVAEAYAPDVDEYRVKRRLAEA